MTSERLSKIVIQENISIKDTIENLSLSGLQISLVVDKSYKLAPVITWLCCDEASDVTNQIIHVQNGTVGIMQQPAVIESFLSEELWSLDQLDRVIGNLVETKKNHDSEVQKKAEPKKS